MALLTPPKVQERVSELLRNHSSAFYITFVFTSVFHSVLTVTAVAGNLLVLIAILKKLSIREPTYALLACLAVSDLGVGLVCHPLYVVWKVDWLINGISDRYYHIHFILSLVSTYFASVSFLTVTAVSCERCVALHYHLRYKSLVTTKKVLVTVVFPWLFSALVNIFNHFFKAVNFYAQISLIPFCFVTTAVAYIRIFCVLRRHHNQIKSQSQAMKQAFDQHPAKQQEFDFQTFRKSVASMLLVYALQLACYVPYCVVQMVYNGEYSLEVGIVRNFALTAVYLNSSLNPVIYCCKLSVIRHAIKNILGFKNVRPKTEASSR